VSNSVYIHIYGTRGEWKGNERRMKGGRKERREGGEREMERWKKRR
jgi:hypothetical protein